MVVYILDVGILIPLDDSGAEPYSHVYNNKYGYYDECQQYCTSLEDAVEAGRNYVINGVENTYAVVSASTNTFEGMSIPEIEESPVEDERFSLADVKCSFAKINDKVVEDFIKKGD